MITYLKGDATCPQAKGNKLIAHICNDLGGWGKGFVLALSKRWATPEDLYRKWHKTRFYHDGGPDDDFCLGNIQIVPVDKYIFVVNMIAQHGVKHGSKGPPIRYDALETCLNKLRIVAIDTLASIHMPRIGCGLAGGKWEKIEPIIQKTLSDINVFIYDYKE
jgi:O-acetyl-ADP-ribose deacetylase (regulator of RNase III)